MTKKIVLILCVISALLSCNKDDVSDNAARLRIKITDAPFVSLREMVVEITSIEVSVSDSTNNVPGEWIPLEFTPQQIDLLTLNNGQTKQVVDQYFRAGTTIRRMRLRFGNQSKVVGITETNLVDRKLVLDDRIKEGVIIDNLNINLYPNVIESVVVDINAAMSVFEENDNLFLNPAVRVFSEANVGGITGAVAPLSAQPFVFAVNATDTILTLPRYELVDGKEPEYGTFSFIGLQPGLWTIHVIPNVQSGYQAFEITDSVVVRKTTALKPHPIQLVPTDTPDNPNPDDEEDDETDVPSA